jgi:hypothetical protein
VAGDNKLHEELRVKIYYGTLFQNTPTCGGGGRCRDTSDTVVRTEVILSYAGYLSFIDLTLVKVETTQS